MLFRSRIAACLGNQELESTVLGQAAERTLDELATDLREPIEEGFLWYSSKYRKNEYISRYGIMNGSKAKLMSPMRMKRRLSLTSQAHNQPNRSSRR